MVVRNIRANEGRALLEMFDRLQKGAQGSSAITVRVLAAADHDGVCATRILVAVLQRAGVKYTVVPVTGNSEIIEHLEQLEEDAEVRSLVLLNCGASLDLQRQLEECDAPSELLCFVIDAHRPLLLANLSSRNQRVIVLDDDPIAENSGLRPPVDEEEPEAASASEDEGGEPQSVVQRLERKRRREADHQTRLERKRQRVNEYYHMSYCATPVAISLFKLARQAARASEDLLWLAAVALVGYQDQGLISDMEYAKLNWQELKETLEGTTDDFGSMDSQHLASGTVPDAASDDEAGSRRPPVQRRAPGGGRRSLRFENELRLTLYKHWSVEEALLHSSYFYGALELQREKGLRSLKNFFATAGLPPSEYRQLYSCMQVPVRRSLPQKFRAHGKAYGLVEGRMFLEQFVRDLGPLGEMYPALFLNELSCLDAVHIVTALLSAPAQELAGSNTEPRKDRAAVNEVERQGMVANFWRAFDAVLCKEPQPLRDGIAEAVDLAKAVQSLGRRIRETKGISKSSRFHWCKIEQPPQAFRHQLAVRRLAVWLLHVVFTYRPGLVSKPKPLLLIVRDRLRDTYLCVGATPTRYTEQDEFGNLFRGVLRRDAALKYRYDFFDKSCIEIAADDFDRFWELLNID